MKILYGVQGTGNGHITRARAMQQAFAEQKAHCQVDYLFSGREKDTYFDMDAFGGWQTYSGLTFAHKNGRIDNWQTIKNNRFGQFLREIKTLDLSGYDLVLTDFEPVSAWAGRRQNKTVIGMGHQYAFHHKIPKAGENPLASFIMNWFAPAKLGLGLHWHHFNQPILPPIADTHDASEGTKIDNKILVYLGFEDANKVVNWLKPFKDFEFYIYSNQLSPGDNGNIHTRALSRTGFQDDLANCAGVICNAGFELASEAIHLGKKLFVKPLHGQMEQMSNAAALEALNLGASSQSLDTQKLEAWLNSGQGVAIHYPKVAKAIVQWLLKGDWTEASLHTLSLDLWQQVRSNDVEDFANIDQFRTLLVGAT